MKVPRGRRGDPLPRRGRLRVEDRRRLHPGHALSQGKTAHQNLIIQLEGNIWLRIVLVIYWDGPLNWDKGCFSNIALLLRML